MFDPDRYVVALRFAAERHGAENQPVPGTDFPYVVHLASVASEVMAVLPEAALDADLAVQCALLHDTIEDTKTSHADLAGRFGMTVADGVLALTKDNSLPKDQQMADSLERIRRQPPAVWAVKLADRITNLAPPPPHWTKARCAEYRVESQQILDALGTSSPALAARLAARIDGYGIHCA